MSKKSIKKYILNEDIAKDVGVEEAMMFSNINFWVEKNRKDEDDYHFHNGKYWMFNSILDFAEQYSFWTPAKIRRIIKNLIEKGYIETGVFNKFGYDKTKWYTTTQKASDLLITSKGNVEIENWY